MEIEELHKLYRKCSGVTTDSRKIEDGAMFFALKGENFDGNDFAMKALEAGARYAIVDRPTLDGANIKGRRYCIVVENVLDTLQKLAAYHRDQFDIPVVGITGTNGKTTTKELVSAVLSAKYNTVATGGNLNNHIGVPLTLLKISDTTEMAVIEMGASAPGEIAALVKIAKPTCGIVTNVGRAHLLGFGSFEGVKKTKGELYDFLRQKGGTVFFNADNPILCEMVSSRNGLVARKYGVITEGATVLPANESEPFLRLQLPGDGKLITTHLVGAYNVDNVMAALCIARHFEVPEKAAIEAIEAYQPSNDRSQMVNTERNVLIVDTYNANPTSMNAALDNFASTGFENKTLILGDMLELGDVSLTEHVDALDKARNCTESIFLVGDEFSKAARGVFSVQCFHDVNALADYLVQNPLSGRTILIKGSHGVHLEKLVKSL
ncbi:MAG: UDP-N-acetylmuramoyl-tripeptide--D-alanyl-D-alanine ligase [Bacteroidales bacterium]|nr:UDP-N-acetylmuramoyl-tripeptide--D-alanyl-D-alanine ligase [Bacteroidales bacterium]